MIKHDPRPIQINRDVSKSCFTFLGLCEQKAIANGAVVLRLRKAGSKTYLIEYPALKKREGDAVCFKWGEVMYALPKGRYIGDFFEDEELVASKNFELHAEKWRVESANH